MEHLTMVFTDMEVSNPWGYGSIPINTNFRGMSIHLPAILMFTRGTRFWPTANEGTPKFIQLSSPRGLWDRLPRGMPRCHGGGGLRFVEGKRGLRFVRWSQDISQRYLYIVVNDIHIIYIYIYTCYIHIYIYEQKTPSCKLAMVVYSQV